MPLLLTFMLPSCTSIPKREATPSRPSSSLIFWSLSCSSYSFSNCSIRRPSSLSKKETIEASSKNSPSSASEDEESVCGSICFTTPESAKRTSTEPPNQFRPPLTESRRGRNCTTAEDDRRPCPPHSSEAVCPRSVKQSDESQRGAPPPAVRKSSEVASRIAAVGNLGRKSSRTERTRFPLLRLFLRFSPLLSDRGVRRCSWTLDGDAAPCTVVSRRRRGRVFICFEFFSVSRLRSFKGFDRGVRRCSWTLWTVTQRRVWWFSGDGGGGSGLRMPAGSLVPSLASEYQEDGDVHKAIGDGEGSKNIRAVHGVKEKEQGNKPTFKRTLRIFVEDGGKRRVQWELERQATEEPPKKGVPLTTVEQISTQVKQDGRLLCWVPRAQSQVHQGSSVQETNVMKRDVGVQTEEYEIVVLGDVRGVELAGMGEKGTKVGEGVPRSAPCKGKAKMDAQDNTIVTLRDPSTSGGTKCLEPETYSSSSEAEEGEFLDEASIISFFDNEEGLLIEQLEKEYEDQERDQKRRLDDGLEGVASLLEMDGGEGDIRPSFFPMASIDGEVTFCKDKGTEHITPKLTL
ncbi:uncharacterized protein G2W53_032538 [Senna tora]|uniref:Uncharacterized protein n=1 Tax=Senna tora TaxID=362788 RepID=A0A834T0M8_9FABA|nr:uncharacterized protein G2W53_032538 [Senna tora]